MMLPESRQGNLCAWLLGFLMPLFCSFADEMFRKPTDTVLSAARRPQTAFHSAVLLLAAFEGAIDARIGDKAEQERLYHIREKSRRERRNNRVHQKQCTRLGAGARVSHARDLFLGCLQREKHRKL
jgi:hypothetical protein